VCFSTSLLLSDDEEDDEDVSLIGRMDENKEEESMLLLLCGNEVKGLGERGAVKAVFVDEDGVAENAKASTEVLL